MGDRLFRTTDRRFALHRCASCALDFLWPVPAPAELATYYPQGYWLGSPESGAGAGLWARLAETYRGLVLRDHVRFVRRIVEQQKRQGSWLAILDVGCGDGSFLTACGVTPAAGLDWSLEAARAVRARGFHAVQGGLDATPFGAGSFSVVTMFHYLEHVTPATPSLEAAKRLLAGGGRLVVQVPNLDCWQRRLLGRRWAGYDPPRHLINYSTQALRHTLKRHGFRVVRVSHASLRDNPTTLANSLAPALYPPARLARSRSRGGPREWGASLAYLAIVLASLPFTLLESAFGYGAAVMVEAAVEP